MSARLPRVSAMSSRSDGRSAAEPLAHPDERRPDRCTQGSDHTILSPRLQSVLVEKALLGDLLEHLAPMFHCGAVRDSVGAAESTHRIGVWRHGDTSVAAVV